jgi:PRTRC genetic system protein A
MIPIHVLTNAAAPALPENGMRYLVAKSGVYKEVCNPFYSARVKVPGIGHLEDVKEDLQLRVPRLPLALLRQVEAFFLAAYEQYRSEAVVLLLANAVNGEWRVAVPRQEVQTGSLHVSYDPQSVEAPVGFEVFGTIHSHAAAGAFHSGTDDKDESCFDGLHITVGNIEKPARSYSARWMICGVSCPAKLEDVVEPAPLPDADHSWLEQITVRQTRAFFEDEFNLHESVGKAIGAAAAESVDVPPDLQEEYDEYMAEAHEAFLDRFSQP